MKKYLLFFVAASISILSAMSQVLPVQNVDKKPLVQIPSGHSGYVSNVANGTKNGSSRWYNYGETMQAFHGTASPLYGNFLFPDTTILVNYGTSGYSGPWIHKLGDVLDVTSVMFNDPLLHPNAMTLDAMSHFSLDSIKFHCMYDRNIADPNIVDTLMFEVSVNDNLSTVYFGPGPLPTNLGTDTVFLRSLPYSYQTNMLNLPNKKVYKIPLTAATYADSLINGIHIISFGTDNMPTVNPGKYVVTSVTFIPGYTWTANTDLIDNKNNVRFISRKEVDNAYPVYTKHDYNISYIVPQDVRYNMAGSWNGSFIPSFAYMGSAPTYDYVHHLIYYKVSTSFNITFDAQSVSCFGGSNGYVDLTVAGGTPPYTYQWSHGPTTQDVNNLVAGNYTVTITDQDSAVSVRLFSITQPTQLQATVSSTPASSCGLSDGAITVSGMTGGTPSYSIVVLNSDSITQSLTDLPAGIYTVKISDSKGCKIIKHVAVNEIGAPAFSVAHDNISCYGLSDGSVSITIPSPIGTPTYAWSNGSTANGISNLAVGSYWVTVTDTICHIYSAFEITEPTPIQATGTVSNATSGQSNGTIIMQVSGGTVPYTYLWSSGQTTKNVNNLSEGTYTVTITDANLCTLVKTFDVISVGIGESYTMPAALLYPNPAQEKLNMSFFNVKGADATIRVFNLYGELVLSQMEYLSSGSQSIIDIHSLSTGLYFVEIAVDGYMLRKKFVKE